MHPLFKRLLLLCAISKENSYLAHKINQYTASYIIYGCELYVGLTLHTYPITTFTGLFYGYEYSYDIHVVTGSANFCVSWRPTS